MRHSGPLVGSPDAMISVILVYWFPITPLMFSALGCEGSLGGLSGSKAMWHAPHDIPKYNGGSIEPSRSLEWKRSGWTSLLNPFHEVRSPPLTSFHFSGLNRGLGNLRIPIAPDEVPNSSPHEFSRWPLCTSLGSTPESSKSQAGSRYPGLPTY